ncbi:MAG: HipA domain-containing protein [Rikenellaceae bacterium]
MKKITACPSTLTDGYSTYSPLGLKRLFSGRKVSHVMNYYHVGDSDNSAILDNISRISLSGVQEKYSAIVDKGTVVFTPKGVQGQYMLKPIPSAKSIKNRHSLPANEHLTMQIAKQIFGIETAESGLIFHADGYPAYITKRFDVAADGSKIKQEDFASLIGKTKQINGVNFKYQASYEEVATEIKRRVAAYPVEVAKFFNQVVFNYIFGNNDAHLKNFSLMQTVDGDYKLTPAYDLINATLHVDDTDFALEGGLSTTMEMSDTYDKYKHPTRADFENFGRVIGLNNKQIDKVVSAYINPNTPAKVESLINRSLLDDKLKRMYLRSYNERMSRFNRV